MGHGTDLPTGIQVKLSRLVDQRTDPCTHLYSVRYDLCERGVYDNERLAGHGAVCETETPFVRAHSPPQLGQVSYRLHSFVSTDLSTDNTQQHNDMLYTDEQSLSLDSRCYLNLGQDL